MDFNDETCLAMTNSQKINIRIDELRKKATELLTRSQKDSAYNDSIRQQYQSLLDQIHGLEMARDIIEHADNWVS